MSHFYLDASAVVKRYSLETGSAWVKTLTDPLAGHTIVLGEITLYELIALSRYTIDRAVNLTQNYRLRGYDAVQLATALIANEALVAASLPALTFVAADSDLVKAANTEGLATDNPNLYS